MGNDGLLSDFIFFTKVLQPNTSLRKSAVEYNVGGLHPARKQSIKDFI